MNVKPWSVDEARTFLESARNREDLMYPAYVLVLVLGLRLGEALGLRWDDVDLDQAEMTIGWQLQRVAGKLLHRRTKTDADHWRAATTALPPARQGSSGPPGPVPDLNGLPRVGSGAYRANTRKGGGPNNGDS
ncbi:hypothetical protein ACWGH8_36330 [Nonomuraea muscovyensis]|uniref:Integrase n=1 Tax=Nonomuraea muscovyensis TaxID=1124761 RepID=A0A7X0C9S7_9ACTN|nr:hypothetical protein [Nonomuraea muscovyensis]MBB6350251.1 integrase [Nonomuraea muscovyensis]